MEALLIRGAFKNVMEGLVFGLAIKIPLKEEGGGFMVQWVTPPSAVPTFLWVLFKSQMLQFKLHFCCWHLGKQQMSVGLGALH